MKKILLLIAATLIVSSCRNHIDLEEKKYAPSTDWQKKFAEDFTNEYGEVAKDIIWMTAMSDTVCLNLEDKTESYDISVYSGNPFEHTDFTYLLAEYKSVKGDDANAISYDYPIGLETIYIVAKTAKGTIYCSKFDTGSINADFELVPESEIMPLHDAMRYRICYEGYSSHEGLDFDYNDLVLEVEYVRGRTSAIVRALAAGCDCAIQVNYNRTRKASIDNGDVLFSEVHEACGFKGLHDYVKDHLVYVVLNTGANNTTKIAETSLELLEDTNASITKIAPKLVAYFTLLSGKKGKDQTITSAFIPEKPGANYPQAILIADPSWQWPNENLRLSAFKSEFRLWIKEPAAHQFWYGGNIWKWANNSFGEPV